MVDLVFVLGFFLLFHFVFYGVWSKSFFKKNWLLNYPILYWLNSHFLILSRNFCIRISWTWYTKSYNLFRNKDVIFLLLEIFFLFCFLQRNCQWSVFSQSLFLARSYSSRIGWLYGQLFLYFFSTFLSDYGQQLEKSKRREKMVQSIDFALFWLSLMIKFDYFY